MAEFLFKKMLTENSLTEKYEAYSSATSYEEEGNPVYPPAKRELAKKRFPFAPKIVTCMVCGHQGPMSDFWTYKGTSGECYACRDERVDLK